MKRWAVVTGNPMIDPAQWTLVMSYHWTRRGAEQKAYDYRVRTRRIPWYKEGYAVVRAHGVRYARFS